MFLLERIIEQIYYLANLQVGSLPEYKTESFFVNTSPDFPKIITFFMFLEFWSSYFQG